MKKKELKQKLAACEWSLQRTNEDFGELSKLTKEQANEIKRLNRLVESFKNVSTNKGQYIAKLEQENKDLRARFQKEWEGKESVESRKAVAYWRESYEIREAETIEYKREIQEKTAQIKNQRDLIEKYQMEIKELTGEPGKMNIPPQGWKMIRDAQQEIEELKIVIKARDEKIEKLKGQWNGTLNIPDPGPMSEIARLGQIIKDQEQEIERLNSRLQAIDVA